MSVLPEELNTRMVDWWIAAAVIDGVDPDQRPDTIAVSGKAILKSSVTHVTVRTSEGSATMVRTELEAVFDEEGHLCTPYPAGHDQAGWPMYRGVRLHVTDDPDATVQDWTWSIETKLDKVGKVAVQIPTFSFSLPAAEQSLNLADVVPTPSTPGWGLPQSEAAALRSAESSAAAAASAEESKQAALDAREVADGVRADAAAGEFDGLSAYQIWLGLGNTGTEADFINWLKGAKGDPGGWVNSVMIAGTVQADTLTTPGSYFRSSGAGAGFPQPDGGLVRVYYAQASNIVQEYIPMPWDERSSRVYYMRQRAGTGPSWGAWRVYASLRYDRAVGTAVYTWDPVAATDCLVSGDSGEISIMSLLAAGITATAVTISRSGNLVTLNVEALKVSTAGSQNLFTSFPAGFRPTRRQEMRVATTVGSGTVARLVQVNPTNTWYSGPGVQDLLSFQVTYRTSDSWPSATPPNSLTFRNGYTGSATVQDLGDGLALLTLQDIDGSAATLSGAMNFPAAFLPFDSPRLPIVYDDGTAPGALADRDTAQIYLSAGKKMTGTQRFICRFAPRVSLAFRPEYSGTAYIAKSGSTVLMEIMSLDTTAGGAGLSPFAVPVAYRPAPSGPKFTCEWTDGTSNQYDISTTTGQFYPPVGKVLKTPIRFMWPATS